MKFRQELDDLVAEHSFLSIILVSSELGVHINEAKSILTEYAASKNDLNKIYYLSGFIKGALRISLTSDRENDVQKFEKLISSHLYVIAEKDFEWENYKTFTIEKEHEVRAVLEPTRSKSSKTAPEETQNNSNSIFAKREAPKKGIAKAFGNLESKPSKLSQEKNKQVKNESKPVKKELNSKVNSFFGKTTKVEKKTTQKKNDKVVKKQEIEEPAQEPEEDMDIDQPENKSEKEKSPRNVEKKRKSPRKKTKRRRIQMDSSSEEEETEGEKLLFGESQEERLRNISLEDESEKILADNTIRSDSSEHEGLPTDSEDEKENKKTKKKKKEKTQFGTAKVIGSEHKPTKQVKKKRYTVDDEGNMVTETYYVKEEMTTEEIEERKIEDEKKKTPPKAKSVQKNAPIAQKKASVISKGPMKQKSISSFFKPKK